MPDFRVLVACCLLMSGTCLAQEPTLAAPPASVVNEAARSFGEYAPGVTFDILINSGPSVPKTIVESETVDNRPTAGAIATGSSYRDPYLKDLFYRSDLVIAGKPLYRWSYPTAGNHFVFSVYLVEVTKVLAGSTSTRTNPPKFIWIARAGGAVPFQGHIIQAIDPNFHLFHLNQEYLFFGKSLGSADLYKVDAERSLMLTSTAVQESSTAPHHQQVLNGLTRDSLFENLYEGASSFRRPEQEVIR